MKQQALEGYLEKKSLTGWKKRYFAVKNGKLYWGKNDVTRKAKNNAEVTTIQKCEALEDKLMMIVKYYFDSNVK